MAAAAWWLLGREADRVESLAAGTLANRTATVADSIDLLMEEVRGGVVDGLLAVRDVQEPRIALAEMVEGNPYVGVGYYFRGTDAVTVWLGDRGELPAPGSVRERAEAGAVVYPWTLPEFESDQIQDEAPAPPARASPSRRPPVTVMATVLRLRRKSLSPNWIMLMQEKWRTFKMKSSPKISL